MKNNFKKILILSVIFFVIASLNQVSTSFASENEIISLEGERVAVQLVDDIVLYDDSENPIMTIFKDVILIGMLDENQSLLLKFNEGYMNIENSYFNLLVENPFLSTDELNQTFVGSLIVDEGTQNIVDLQTGEQISTLTKGTTVQYYDETEQGYHLILGDREVLLKRISVEDVDVESNTSERQNALEVVEVKPSTELSNTLEEVKVSTTEQNNTTKTIEVVEITSIKDEGSIISTLSVEQPKISFKTTDRFFKVTTHNVTVYDNSSGTLKPVGFLEKDQVYPRVSDYGDWHRINYGTGYGYVWKDATIPSDGVGIKSINHGLQNTSRTFTSNTVLTVYDNSSGSLVPFARINKGISYPIISMSGDWLRIDYAGRIGYVYKPATKLNFQSTDQFFEVISHNVTVYDNSGGTLKPVGFLEKGQVYPRLSDYGDWHRIKYGNGFGFVWKDATVPANGNVVKNINKSLLNSQRTFTSTNVLTVYDNTSGQLVPFARINKGVSYPVISIAGDWLRIDYSGRIGYVYKPATKLNFIPSDKYFEVMQTNVTVYDNSTGALKPVGFLKIGQVYPRLSDYGAWHKIKYGNGNGFIWKEATEPVFGSPNIQNENNSLLNSNNKFVTKKPVSVYDNTSGQLVEFGILNRDVSYPFIRDYGRDWIQVDFGGRIGYVLKSAVSFGPTYNFTNYDITLADFIKVQNGLNPPPQTDLYKNITTAYIHSSVANKVQRGITNNDGIRFRTAANFGDNIYGTYPRNTHVLIKRIVKGDLHNGSTDWYEIEYNNSTLFVHNSLINITNVAIPKNTANVREGATNNSHIFSTVSSSREFIILREVTGDTVNGNNVWFEIRYTDVWRNAKEEHFVPYLDPTKNDEFQHLVLNKSIGISATELNKVLVGKGVLQGLGQAFIEAGNQHSINEIYLLSHILLETGNGTSPLATGQLEVGKNSKGELVLVNETNRSTLTDIKKTYNMFGYGANDSDPNRLGAIKAYELGWFTPEEAIIGGAATITNSYFARGQNTLYKMRWNYLYLNSWGGYSQYATDMGWAVKQITRIKSLYENIDTTYWEFDVVKLK